MKENKNREKILKGNIKKVLISLALPIILGNAIQTIYQVVDMYWVSRLADGDNAVAAVNFVWPMIFVSIAFGIGMNIAGTSIISQFVGLNKEKEAQKVAGQLVSFSLLFSLALGIFGAVFGKQILIWMGAEGAILQHGWDFVSIIFAGMPTMFVFFAFQSIKQGQGDTVTPMILAGGSVVLNIILDPIFMFTLNMGVAGAAWATVVSRALNSIAGIYLLFFTDNGIKLKVADLKFNKKVLQKIVKVGLPSALGHSVEGIGFMVLNIFVLGFGASTIAAFGIGNKINSLILMPAMGIGQALAAVVGQNLGADQIDRASQAVKESIKLSVTILAVGGIILFLLAPQIVGIFTSDEVVLEQGTFYLQLITLSIPLMGIFQSFVGVFQGSGHTMTAMMITTGRLWALRIPLILFLRNFPALGERAVWYAMVGSNFIICIIAFGLYLIGHWKEKIVDEEEDYVEDLEVKLAE
ncbi:MATE family efflux transporter [Proteinivorax hydrogeniformans]|uniref:MATE family efflux transporter n=1 Tax=Proteinivorax hydrogeniformans TaxID=1826727 RepID=A0AAU8HQG6_9FIRM